MLFCLCPNSEGRSAESTTCTQSSEVRARVACSPFHRPRPTCSSAITCEAKWNQPHFISRTKNAAACVFTQVARLRAAVLTAVDAVAVVVCERNMHSLRRKKQSRNESLATSFFLSITPRRSSLGAPSTPLDIFQRPQYGMIHSSVYTLKIDGTCAQHEGTVSSVHCGGSYGGWVISLPDNRPCEP